jgi:hypothetical protein
LWTAPRRTACTIISMTFDGAGKPYRSGPSWRGAIIIMVGAIILIVLGFGFIFPLIFD